MQNVKSNPTDNTKPARQFAHCSLIGLPQSSASSALSAVIMHSSRRRGSVLILVVVLLVLLALIGTAYISSARTDRVASNTSLQNLNINLLADSVAAAAEGMGVQANTSINGPANPVSSATTGLADRVPSFGLGGAFPGGVAYWASLTNAFQGGTAFEDPGYSPTLWQALPQSTAAPNAPPSNNGVLDLYAPVTGQLYPDVVSPFNQILVNRPQNVVPTFVPIYRGPTPPAINPLHPALLINLGGTYVPVLAGDADGDGIADCLLWRIPNGYINGVQYYAGVRIIDNNAAVNVNTAFSRDYDYVAGGASPPPVAPNYGFFRSGTGLFELLSSYVPAGPVQALPTSEIDKLTSYTWTGIPSPAWPNGIQPLTIGDYGKLILASRIGNPLNWNGDVAQAIPRSDSAELANGFCVVSPQTSAGQRASLLEALLAPSIVAPEHVGPYSADTSLTSVSSWYANNFAGMNVPTTPSAVSPRPILTTRNPTSNAINPKFESTGTVGGPTSPLVPGMLPYVASTKSIPNSYGTTTNAAPGWQQGTQYSLNDIVSSGGMTYISVANGNTGNNPLDTVPADKMYQWWKRQPWHPIAGKTSVNTATFRDLWRAYWMAMCNPSAPNQPAVNLALGYNSNSTASQNYDPYQVMSPVSGGYNPFYSTAIVKAGAQSSTLTQAMFRSSLRDDRYTGFAVGGTNSINGPGGASVNRFDPQNMMLLRAALAAVNTLAMRSGGYNKDLNAPAGTLFPAVVSRTITLNANVDQVALAAGTPQTPTSPGGTAVMPVTVQVYSTAPQPYITEVFVDTDETAGAQNDPNSNGTSGNPKGYIAIELYNPCSAPVNINGWQLAVLDRRVASGTPAPSPAIGVTSTYPNMTIDANPASTLAGQYIGALAPTATGIAAGTPETTILPYHYLVLENFNPAGSTGNDAQFRPSVLHLPTTGTLQNATNVTNYPNAASLYVPNLDYAINDTTTRTPAVNVPGGELVLLRPRMNDLGGNPVYTSCDDPDNLYNEGTLSAPNLCQMVPVDSFDFTGISQMTSKTAPNYSYIHYVRATDNPTATTHFGYWRCVWPGRYDGTQGSGTTITPRQETVDFSSSEAAGDTTQTPAVPWAPITLTTPAAFGVPGYPTSYNAFAPMMFGDYRMPGPNPLTNGTAAQFPYGGFARDGDLLQVPFVGAYTVFLPGNFRGNVVWPASFLEMNSLPMDVSFSDDCDSLAGASDDPVENVGRFCPIFNSNGTPVAFAVGQTLGQPSTTQIPDPAYRFETNQGGNTFNGWGIMITGGSPGAGAFGKISGYNDAAVTPSPNTLLMSTQPLNSTFGTPGSYMLTPPGGTNGAAYYWTGNIFSYLTVTDPSDDYLPNVDPGANVQSPQFGSAAYTLTLPTISSPFPVNNDDFTKNGDQTQEHTIGVDGLININTASAKVLSMLPWVPGDPNGIDETIGQAIVADRANGPYNNIMDLARVMVQVSVPPHQSVWLPLSLIRSNGGVNPAPPTSAEGNVINAAGDPLFLNDNSLRFSGMPYVPPVGDFQTQFLAIDRVSNLITTRSDSFTVYVVVEGWTNPGTPTAALVSTRRVGYILDRSGITPTNSSPKLIAIPGN